MTKAQKVLAVFEGMTDSAYEEYLLDIVSISDVMGYADGALDINLSDIEAWAVATAINRVSPSSRSW